MSEERPQHPREPTAGGEADAEAPGADEAVGKMTEDPADIEHPTKPAVGGEEAEETQRAGDG